MAKNTTQRAPKFVILLPPSEGKAVHGDPLTKWSTSAGIFGGHLRQFRNQVVDALNQAKGGNAALLGVNGLHLTRARTANQSLTGGATLPAFERYTGVVWDHLDLNSMTQAQRTCAMQRVIIISGLLGAVSAADPVPNYRLKMSARLVPMGTLSRWWREPLSAVLNSYLAGLVVVDLLPLEHRAAFMPDITKLHAYIRVGLLEKSGKPGGHDAKAAKGRCARFVLDHAITGSDVPKALKEFRDPRFVLTLD